MMNPLVSIIIPTYNREHLIGATLNSVLAQTYTNWECIVVDDGSKDNTEELMEFYSKKDNRIQFHRRPEAKTKGASSCRNYGLERSKGQLIQFLDSDDLLDKNKLTEQLKIYSPDRNADLFTSKWGWFQNVNNLNSRFKYNYRIYKNYMKGSNLLSDFGYFNSFFPLHIYLISRELINKAGGWDESLTNNDDAEFFTRVILKANNILFAEKAKVYYRVSNKNKLSEINSEAKALSAIKSWEMINSHIYFNNGQPFGAYVQNALFNLNNKIMNTYPELLKEYGDLFNKRKNFNSPYYRFRKNISIILSLKQ